MSAFSDDLRAIDQVRRRRASPELAAAFAGAVRELFRELGWWTDVVESGDFECVPPGYTDVSAAYRAENGGLIDLRIGATSERHVDIVHLLSRLLALAASGCGRLPAESIEVRRLLVRVMAADGVQADDAAIDAYAASPAVSRPFQALMSVIEDVRAQKRGI